jgi:epoxyqueuosine reductase
MNNEKVGAGDSLVAKLEANGFRAAFLPYACIEQITDIYNEYAENADAPFRTKEWFLSAQPPDLPFEPLSILVIANQSPGGEISLSYNGKEVLLPIPPTYIDESINKRLSEALELILKDYQRAEAKAVSLKMLAVLSGLGKYGRNALCYLEGFGSFCNFDAYYTDIPYVGEPHELALMDSCGSCGLCIANCPNNVLGGQYKVDVPRCLTLWNEHDGPMPEWMSPGVHHTAVGCMRCQEICPVNKAAPKIRRERLELNEAETDALLSAASSPQTELPPDLEKKLLDYDLSKMFAKLAGRNIKLALEAIGA